MMGNMMSQVKLTVHTAVKEEVQELREEFDEVRALAERAIAGVSEVKEGLRKIGAEVEKLQEDSTPNASGASGKRGLDREIKMVVGGFPNLDEETIQQEMHECLKTTSFKGKVTE
eukprot:4576245-Karenia_brevis.AAC.1